MKGRARKEDMLIRSA